MSTPPGDFNATLRALAEVTEELASVPADDFGRRQDLKDREAELRAELRQFSSEWTDHLSIDQLERRIALLSERIEAHYGNRLSHTSGGQTGFGGGLDPQILHWMNRAMDQTGDIDAMKAELARLKDQLANLKGD